MAKYNEFGQEIPDSRPVEMPLNFRRPKPLNQLVSEIVARQIRELAEEQGAESFEEADDFDVGDEEFPTSIHEMTDEQEVFNAPSENRGPGDKALPAKATEGPAPTGDPANGGGAAAVAGAGEATPPKK